MPTETNRSRRLIDLTIAGLCLALCLALPFLTGQIPQIGQLLSPMHLPVFLCGFLCEWPYGLAVGLIAPVLRSLLFGMPPLFPTAVGMTVELAVYGLTAALLYRAMGKKKWALYPALVGSMIAGRLAGGAFQLILLGVGVNSEYSFSRFLASYVTGTLPGIAVQLILVPPVVIAVEKALSSQRRSSPEVPRV